MKVYQPKIRPFMGALLAVILIISCRRDPTTVSNGPAQTVSGNGGSTVSANRPPVARAGADQVITLYANNLLLNGTGSSDPDNNIAEYAWTKIAGPSAGSIVNAGNAQTPVKDFAEGTYLFELKITDAGSLTATDTVQIKVQLPAREEDRDIYLAGSLSNGTKMVATYWKNGIPVSLTDGSNTAVATGIAVMGNDIHVIGYEIGGENGNITIARYWKNGVPVFLTNGYSRATAIAVSGNDVFVAGWEFANSGALHYKYWKNGSPVNVTGNPPGAALAFAGNNVYIAGIEHDGYLYSYIDDDGDTVYARYSVAKYWKNGSPVILSDGKSHASVTDMAVSGDDVYVAGLEQVGGDRVTRYWKNGVPVTLANSGSIENGIAVSGNDVFVAGTGSNGYGILAAKCWKNGVPSLLPTTSREPHATDIVLFGNDVYIAGFDYDYGVTNTSVAKYWKNGVAVPLTNGTYWASVYSIAVVYR